VERLVVGRRRGRGRRIDRWRASHYELAPNSQALLTLAIRCERARSGAAASVRRGTLRADHDIDVARSGWAAIETSSERFNEWDAASAADFAC